MRADGLSIEDVRRIAHLARLELTDAELADARVKLGAVMAYMERLSRVDVERVAPFAHAPTEGAMREDVAGPTLPTAALLGMAPESWEGFVRVPKVLGDGGGA
ncbi:MAG TPA: Asp-tRNA(Asn)/Glu-tRNA(Gln) amidotransferase subunit GatC [Phycisphaerales bacterium]|nr:Asp-tRNA(Asn)/Glu-tRNA(Gln) amidotransferase subunit GatC [Phycisphaerales bacterium]